jgi:hypothetical protein
MTSSSIYTVSLTNPSRRNHILATHDSLSDDDADEIVAIYEALGYKSELIQIREEVTAQCSMAA